MMGLDEIVEANEEATQSAVLRQALQNVHDTLWTANGTLPHVAAGIIKDALRTARKALEQV